MRYFLLPLCLVLSLNSFSLAALADGKQDNQGNLSAAAKAKPVLTLKPNATEGYAQTMREPRAPNAPQQVLKQVSPPIIIPQGMGNVSAVPLGAFLVK